MSWRRGRVDGVAAPISKTCADIVLSDGTKLESVAVHLGTGSRLVRVTKGMTVLKAREDITAHTRQGNGRRAVSTLEFADGEVWTVSDCAAGCVPCGQRRR